MLRLDVELTARQKAELSAIPPADWFAQVRFRNMTSPAHPRPEIAALDGLKHALVADWLERIVPDCRVLDLFSANGAFAIRALQSGARSVVGVEAHAGRVRCARQIAEAIGEADRLRFVEGDVFDVLERLDEPFDVVLCLGGLYHVADPARLLRLIRRAVTGEVILQTSNVMSLPGTWARFVLRRCEEEDPDLPSLRAGSGVWHCSPGCIRALLQHADLHPYIRRGPLRPERGRPRWYLVCARPGAASDTRAPDDRDAP